MHGANEPVPATGKLAVATPVDVAAKISEGDSALAAKDFRVALYAYQDAIMADPKSVPELLGHKTLAMTLQIDTDVKSANQRQTLGKRSRNF